MPENVLRKSYWTETQPVTSFPSLQGDTTADVCIVGAGIAGLSIAYNLVKAGKKVVVLDDGPVAGGQTSVTTAHLSNEIDDRYTEIERLHGEEGARLAAESHTAAIQFIAKTAVEENIDCDFQHVDGWLFLPPGESQDFLRAEYEATCRTGIVKVEWAPRVPWPDFDTGPALRYLGQAEFHPLKYTEGLAKAIQEKGGKIYCDTHAEKIQGGENATVEIRNGAKVHCDFIVVATNSPINDLVAIHTKQAGYQSYVIAAPIQRGIIPRGLYWDTLDPYHYVRLQPLLGEAEKDLLIIGGEDHKTGQADDGEQRFVNLELWAKDRFPKMEAIRFQWSGEVLEPIDGLAFIGRNPLDKENVFIATGDSGMGMTHGTIAGMLISDLILGRENPWAKLYDPSRKTLRAIVEFAKENLNVAASYTSWLTPGEISSIEELSPGQGAVMRRGLNKYAIYRDEKGKIIELTAVCPHLKCHVAWNAVESTWDCPCHGSRFSPEGKVIQGPANCDLKPVEKEDKS